MVGFAGDSEGPSVSAGVEVEEVGLVFGADGGFVDVVVCQVESVDVVGAWEGAHG